jgi:hypothetical protein
MIRDIHSKGIGFDGRRPICGDTYQGTGHQQQQVSARYPEREKKNNKILCKTKQKRNGKKEDH